MLGSFGAVACVQALAALTVSRRGELALLGLTGATRRQVLASVGLEAALVALTGTVAGAVVGLSVAWSVSQAMPGTAAVPVPTGGCLLAVLVAFGLTALGTGPAALWSVGRGADGPAELVARGR